MTTRTRTDKVARLHEQLARGVAQLASSNDWQQWLNAAAQFHTYSFSNILLITMQRPDATRVAGYRTWQRLGRQVRKGERGIRILAPMIVADRQARAAGDEDATKLLFRAVSVFDIMQTDGEPLPHAPTQVEAIHGDDPTGLWDTLTDQARDAGFAVTLGGAHQVGQPDAKGVCKHTDRQIVVRHDMSPAQQAKTLAHELAHALLHGDPIARDRAEVEAESVAYIVCQAVGLHTDSYSFGYVTGWSNGDLALVQATGERVTATARTILHRIEADNAAQPAMS